MKLERLTPSKVKGSTFFNEKPAKEVAVTLQYILGHGLIND